MTQLPKYWPNLTGKATPEAELAHRQTFSWLTDHDTALLDLNLKIENANAAKAKTAAAAAPAVTTASVATTATSTATTVVAKTLAMTFGQVNNQTAAYAVQTTDYASLVTMNNASPVTLKLNRAVNPAWYGAVQNLGAGTVTLAPDTTLGASTINGVATVPLVTGQGAWVFFDGLNWWAVLTPVGTGGVPSVNGITAAVTVAAGAGITVGTTGSTITVAATGSGGVPSVNGISGAVTIAAGTGVTVGTAGSTITVGASGGAAGYLKVALTINFGGATSGSFSGTVNLTGAVLGAACFAGVSAPYQMRQGWVSAFVFGTGVVNVYVDIPTSNTIAFGNYTFQCVIFN